MGDMAIGVARNERAREGQGRAARWAFRALVTVESVLILGQAALAGQFLGGNPDALNWHQLNAFLIFFGAIGVIIAAIASWRRGGPAWPTAASVLLLVAVVLQTAVGYARQMGLHVPLGVALFGLILILLFGAWGTARR